MILELDVLLNKRLHRLNYVSNFSSYYSSNYQFKCQTYILITLTQLLGLKKLTRLIYSRIMTSLRCIL